MGTERLTATPQTAEKLILRVQFPMVIPKEIKTFNLTKQLPPGDIAYFDPRELNTLRFIDQITWAPIVKKGVEIRANPREVKHRYAALIIYTPPRNPDDTVDNIIQQLSHLLKITSKKENRITIEQNLGVLFIVEQKDKDQRIGWRQNQLTRSGLVVDKKKGESVVLTDSYIISFARRQKQHPTINLSKGKISRNMIRPFIEAVKRHAGRRGFTANTTELEKEAMITDKPQVTIVNLRDGRNVTYEAEDSNGKKIIIRVSEKGDEFVSAGKETLKEFVEQQKQTKRSEVKHRPGDVIQLSIKCGDCPDGYFQDIYYMQLGKTGRTLRRDRICNGSHADGYPIYIIKSKYEGPIRPPAKAHKETTNRSV